MALRISLCILIGILGLVFLSGCHNKALHKDTELIMGTFVEVVSPDPKAAPIVFGEINRIDGLMSKYRPESEVSRLNRQGQLSVSPDTYYVLKKAREFWELTDGAFDITVGPLMDLWGFTDKQYRLPADDEVKKTLEAVGTDKIIFTDADYMVKFSVSGMKVDLGAIAKGYAVDCAVRKLKESGITSCLINAGGQIYCLGDKFGRPWRVAIKAPRSEGFQGYVELKDRAVSTSGDYEQYFMKEKQRYSHIFDPKTGYPKDAGIISVTVIAPDGVTADALSTSVFALGRQRGMELAKKFSGTEVRIIEPPIGQ